MDIILPAEAESSKKEAIEQFFSTLSRQVDERSIIVTAHLFIEYWLDWLLTNSLPQPKKLLDSVNLTFNQKLAVAESLDMLSEKLSTAARRLNHMRNEVAHKLKYTIDKQDLKLISDCLGFIPKEFQELVKLLGTPKAELAYFGLVFSGYVTGYVIGKKESKSIKKDKPKNK